MTGILLRICVRVVAQVAVFDAGPAPADAAGRPSTNSSGKLNGEPKWLMPPLTSSGFAMSSTARRTVRCSRRSEDARARRRTPSTNCVRVLGVARRAELVARSRSSASAYIRGTCPDRSGRTSWRSCPVERLVVEQLRRPFDRVDLGDLGGHHQPRDLEELVGRDSRVGDDLPRSAGLRRPESASGVSAACLRNSSTKALCSRANTIVIEAHADRPVVRKGRRFLAGPFGLDRDRTVRRAPGR